MGKSLPLRLLRRRHGALLAFIAIYSFGFSAFLLVNDLIRETRKDMATKSRELLEGDIRFLSRRALTSPESAVLDSAFPVGTPKAEVWGFLSMVRSNHSAKLVQVRAVSKNYPLYGNFRFDPSSSAFDLQHWQSGEAILPPELCAALSLKPGDTVWLGEKGFRVAAIYTDRPGGHFQFWELGGRIYIPLEDMPETQLEQKGSRIFRYQFFGLTPSEDAQVLARKLENRFSDPEIELTAHSDSDSELGRTLSMVGGFLQLAALCIFWLAAAGGAFFFRHHLAGERRVFAILKSLGASPRQIFLWTFTQNTLLSFIAALLSLGLALLEKVALRPLETSMGLVSEVSWPWETALISMILLPITALLFSLGDLLVASRIPARSLFRPSESGALPRWIKGFLLGLQGLFFSGLAFAFSRSLILSGSAVLAAGLGLLLLLSLGGGGLTLLWSQRHRFHYGSRIMLGTLYFGRDKALAAFLTLGFVLFATALIPSLRAALILELRAPTGNAVPRLFLFDVQEDQVDSVSHWMKMRGKQVREFSPMIRARLDEVNGKPYHRDSGKKSTLEESRNRQFRNRGYNLSYRKQLSVSEKISSGKFWSGPALENGPLPEISVEKAFAKRLKFSLGDTLTFDVQGVDVSGLITSFREVHWTSFQPNFFVLFQPGALEMAPKNFLGTVGECAPEEVDSLQTGLARAFPSVTVIHLGEAVDRILVLLGTLQKLVTILAFFALWVGIAMLILVAEAFARDLERSALLLQILGESPNRMLWRLSGLFVGFTLTAGICGVALSQMAAFAVCRFLWNIPWTPDMATILLAFLLASLTGLGCAGYAVFRIRSHSPRELLAGEA